MTAPRDPRKDPRPGDAVKRTQHVAARVVDSVADNAVWYTVAPTRGLMSCEMDEWRMEMGNGVIIHVAE